MARILQGAPFQLGTVAVAAALAAAGLVRASRKPRRCTCCPAESPLARWRLRAWAVILPGPGQVTRIRYGLGRGEYAERVRSGMAMDHPDWITGELAPESEETLADLEAETWEAP